MKAILFLGLLFASAAHANLNVYPSSVNFFNVPINNFGQSQMIQVQNFGNEQVQVNMNNGCFGDFYVSGFCGLLSPGGSCTVDVRFSPRRQGYQSCSIWFNSSLGGGAIVSVSGQGVQR